MLCMPWLSTDSNACVQRIFAGAMREGMPLQRSPVLRRAYIAYLVSQQQYERANDIACVSAFYSCCWAKVNGSTPAMLPSC